MNPKTRQRKRVESFKENIRRHEKNMRKQQDLKFVLKVVSCGGAHWTNLRHKPMSPDIRSQRRGRWGQHFLYTVACNGTDLPYIHTSECIMVEENCTKQQHPQRTRNIHFLTEVPNCLCSQSRGATCVFQVNQSIAMSVGIQRPYWLWRGSMKLFNAHGYSGTNSTFFGSSAHVTRKHAGPRITPSNSAEKPFKFAFRKEASQRKQTSEHPVSNQNWRICDYCVTVDCCEF